VAAKINDDTWSVTFEDLPSDRFYFLFFSLTVDEGSARKLVKERITVGTPSAVFSELATLQEHMDEERITAQTSPCSNSGLGACDMGITDLSTEHGGDHFPLFAAYRRGPWYANSNAIPTTPVDERGGLPTAATENALRVLSARLEARCPGRFSISESISTGCR
jgi:hypothetical protein